MTTNQKSGNGIGIGAALGVAIGAAYGATQGNMSLSIALGISIGVAIGAIFDISKTKNNRQERIGSLPIITAFIIYFPNFTQLNN